MTLSSGGWTTASLKGRGPGHVYTHISTKKSPKLLVQKPSSWEKKVFGVFFLYFLFLMRLCCEVIIWVLGIKADIFEKLLGFQSHLTDPSVVGGGL